jgi:hypothetical protein
MKVNKDEVIEDLNKIKDIVILSQTEAGKQFLSALTEDIIATINDMVVNREQLTHMQFISKACDIKAKLEIARAIKKAPANEKFLKELLEETLAQ